MAAAATQFQPPLDHLLWTVAGWSALFMALMGVMALLVLVVKHVWYRAVLRDLGRPEGARESVAGKSAAVADRDPAMPYRARALVLTQGELAFYHVLPHLAGDRYALLAQVRMADLVRVPDSLPNRLWWFRRVSQKHIDFILCDPETMRPVLLIELDDQTHGRAHRKRRDRFLDDVAASASLLLMHVPAQQAYDVQGLADQVARTALAITHPHSHPPTAMEQRNGGTPRRTRQGGKVPGCPFSRPSTAA